MQIGTVFPQTEIGDDPGAIRDYAQAVEDLGYAHILAYDHVLGAATAGRPDWAGAYSERDMFHEPFVLFGYLAGITRRLEFVSGVIILPQRQTALVAKQATEVYLLNGGRFRLGVGIGWNPVEYDALGQEFRTRARRMEEQLMLLRRLFQEPVVTFAGTWDRIDAAGINPRPAGGRIPIWIGATAEAAVERVARLGDGWFPQMRPEPEGRQAVEKLRAAAATAGRDPATIGIEARLNLGRTSYDQAPEYARAWQAIGATHLAVNTMGAGLATVKDHIDALARMKAILDTIRPLF